MQSVRGRLQRQSASILLINVKKAVGFGTVNSVFNMFWLGVGREGGSPSVRMRDPESDPDALACFHLSITTCTNTATKDDSHTFQVGAAWTIYAFPNPLAVVVGLDGGFESSPGAW